MVSTTGQEYFETPELRQCMGAVYDAVINQRGLIYLKGPGGAGKTLFAKRLSNLFASKYQVLLLTVNPMVEIQSLIRAELELPAAEDDDWPPSELTEQAAGQQRMLLIVDDAELLGKLDVRSLWKLHKIGIPLVFVGKGGFAGGLQLKNIQEQDIPLLTRQQCREYLSSQNIAIPADGILDEVYAKTEGNPGRMDELSLLKKWQHDRIDEIEEDEAMENADEPMLGKGGSVVIGGLLLLAMSFWLYLEYGQKELQSPEPVASVGPSAAIPKPPVKPYQDSVVPEEAPALEDEEKQSAPAESVVMPEAQDRQDAVSKPAVVALKPEVLTDTIVSDSAWLAAQKANDWTLQVAGAWGEKILRDQVEDMALTEKYGIFSRSRKGRFWYSLVVGVYPDAAAAVAANVVISSKFGVTDAWARSFGEIQKVIATQKHD